MGNKGWRQSVLLTLLTSLATKEKWLEAYVGPSEGSGIGC